MKIELFIAFKPLNGFKFYKNDKKRLKKYPNLRHSRAFILSRSLKWHYKLKDHICISHKDSVAIIARSKWRVGVDIEKIKERNFNAVMKFCFNENEINLVQNADDKILMFYKIWTAKEACIKYLDLNFSDIKSVNFKEIRAKFSLKFISFNGYIAALVYKKG